ncbi:Phage protein, HK97 gp10 family [Candidatus Glomeribacter gigasporarum BEG34]|uniref:Phage protein, HK97 gp10 family n=1 Tax=Candidatus Glomeribacter gigasporarum BEG34 TaxID=1070319 RepID=G2JAU4_9BURK|nr:HK97-gp10 family putative phage morphogenesis protein [Candidatus Glomeribacter gigasporarum]CCD29896.1 Phage protein, HK97 gp10 family [Candidatus Glomeribacter gigasporarum BEG34]
MASGDFHLICSTPVPACLDRRLQGRIGRSAVMAGARVIAREAQARAPVLAAPTPQRKPGTLKKNIRAKAVRSNQTGRWEAVVGVRTLGAKKIVDFKAQTGKSGQANPDDPFYWRFVEFGTVKMAARPFLRPAFETKKQQAADTIKAQLRKRIEQAASQARRG